MPEPEESQDQGGSSDPIEITADKDEIAAAIHFIIEQKASRKVINDAISARKARIKTRGVNLHGFMLALRSFEQDEAHRLAIDTSYQLTREALGIQLDLALQ